MLMVNRLDVYVEIDHPVISWNRVTIWFVCVCVCVCVCVRVFLKSNLKKKSQSFSPAERLSCYTYASRHISLC